MPPSIQTSVFVRAELGSGERAQLSIVSLMGQRVQCQVAEVDVMCEAEESEE